MANSILDTGSPASQSADSQINYPESPDSQTFEETMPPPTAGQLQQLQPRILIQLFHGASINDQTFLKNLHESCQNLSGEIQKSIKIQSKVTKLCQQVNFCTMENGAEDFWSFLTVWPILKLARKLGNMEREILMLPLSTANISPTNLLPMWHGTKVARRIDFGLAIQLDDITKQLIQNLPGQEDEERGIGPASTIMTLQTNPLFCHIEVKKQHQIIDPIVQLGVWTSAVYSRWEQVKISNSPSLSIFSSRDFPTSFGWTIEGHLWSLHMIRRLSDGSRQITKNFRAYDTQSHADIYLIIATLYSLMDYAKSNFREDFLASVLHSAPKSIKRSVRKPSLDTMGKEEWYGTEQPP